MLIFGARIMSFKSLGVMETVSMLYEVTSKPVSRGLSKESRWSPSITTEPPVQDRPWHQLPPGRLTTDSSASCQLLLVSILECKDHMNQRKYVSEVLPDRPHLSFDSQDRERRIR